MRVGEDWVEVGVGNVSSSGMMVKFPGAPPIGTYIEVRRRGTSITGEVVWSTQTRFGLRSFEEIDQDALVEAGLQAKSLAPPPVGKSFWHWRKSR